MADEYKLTSEIEWLTPHIQSFPVNATGVLEVDRIRFEVRLPMRTQTCCFCVANCVVRFFWLCGPGSSILDNMDLCLQVRTANVNTPVARGVVSHIVRQVKIVGCGAGPIQPRAPTLYLHLPHPLAWCLRRRSCFGVRLDSRRASNNKRASCYCVAVELGVISGRLRVCPSGPDNTQFHSLVARTPLLSRDDDVRFRDVCRHRPPALVCSFCWRFSLACCS